MDESRVIVWYSDGAASAVAAKLAVEKYGDRCEVVKCDTTSSEHPDNERFRGDVEAWIGRTVTLIRSEKYRNVDDVFERTRYMAGIAGARCTTELKKVPRFAYQRPEDIHVFGLTVEEGDRIEQFKRNNPELRFDWILRDRFIRKVDCFRMIERAGIKRPAMYDLSFEHNNCFAAETEFITDIGVRRLGDAAGETVKVRGAYGKWVEAEIRSFGVQPLMRVTVKRNTITREYYATAGHRWILKSYPHGHKAERITANLKPGDRLCPMFGRISGIMRPSAFGIAQGIVFGDGSRSNTLNSAGSLVLCGEKANDLLKYFPMSPVNSTPNGPEVKDLPRHWKDAPPLNECQSYLYGWLAGYFATDGCAGTDGGYSISSARLENVEVARDIALRLGIGTNGIRKSMRTGFGDEPTPLYTLSLIGATLREDFFLRAEHRRRFLASKPRKPQPWFVVSVEPTDRLEEVFCAVVPDGAAFTLEGNILTGNCLGCPKATSPGYWNRTRQHFPDVFERRARQSREIGARLVRWNGERIFLDELPEDAGLDEEDGDIECGPFCQMPLTA